MDEESCQTLNENIGLVKIGGVVISRITNEFNGGWVKLSERMENSLHDSKARESGKNGEHKNLLFV